MNEAKKLIMSCCICGREKTEQGWQYRFRSDETNVLYSHGFCSSCYEIEIMKIRLQPALTATSLYR